MSTCGEILSNTNLKNDYFAVAFYAPETAASARAGEAGSS